MTALVIVSLAALTQSAPAKDKHIAAVSKCLSKGQKGDFAKRNRHRSYYKEKAPLAGKSSAPAGTMLSWARRPASRWGDGSGQTGPYPLGNGAVGAMVYGGVHTERVQLNEHSLWSGSDRDHSNLGTYQSLGDLFFETGHMAAENYRRILNCSNAVHTVEYTDGGIAYTREYFCSYPDQVMVLRFTSSKPKALSGTLRLADARSVDVPGVETMYKKLVPASAKGNRATFGGELPNGLEYEAQALIVNEGGSIVVEGNSLRVKNADSLTILFSAGTSFQQDHAKGWLGAHPHRKVTDAIDKAAAKSYDVLKKAHVADYQTLFNRVTLDLGKSDESIYELTTNERIGRYKQSNRDPELEALIFHGGRYSLISCSRPGTPPANLMGMWCGTLVPQWSSDYHTDVNLGLNYWGADPAALTECAQPVLDYISSIIPVRRAIYRKARNSGRGWQVKAGMNLFGGGERARYANCNGWLAQHFWMRYAFTQNKDYLRKTVYPLYKELCEYWEDILVTRPDGTLLSPSGCSPENKPKRIANDPSGKYKQGSTFDQALIWDVFSNYIEASRILGVDEDYRKKITAMRAKLLGPQIGSWGQLQEWSSDVDSPDDRHRHRSHLVGVYSGKQVSPLTMPKVAEAAKVALAARGGAVCHFRWHRTLLCGHACTNPKKPIGL